MRVPALTAALFVLSLQGPAQAADCTKGMLWPYVRVNGDCLTDAEIKAGQSGVYSGQLDTNPDVASVKIDKPVQQAPSSGGFFSNMLDFIPSTSGDDAVYDSLGPAGLIRHDPSKDAACHKGALWPFVRSPGDCLTDAERRVKGATVYKADEVPAGAIPASVSKPAPKETATAASANQPPQQACRKSAFWPFVREEGDCPTDQEKKDAADKK